MSLLWTERAHPDVIAAQGLAAGIAEDVRRRLRSFADEHSIVIN
jgi:hypothetical protein